MLRMFREGDESEKDNTGARAVTNKIFGILL